MGTKLPGTSCQSSGLYANQVTDICLMAITTDGLEKFLSRSAVSTCAWLQLSKKIDPLQAKESRLVSSEAAG